MQGLDKLIGKKRNREYDSYQIPSFLRKLNPKPKIKEDKDFNFFEEQITQKSDKRLGSFVDLTSEETETSNSTPNAYNEHNKHQMIEKKFVHLTFQEDPEDFYKKITGKEMDKKMLKKAKNLSDTFTKFFKDCRTLSKMTKKETKIIMGYYSYQYFKLTRHIKTVSDERMKHLQNLVEEMENDPTVMKRYIGDKAYTNLLFFMSKKENKYTLCRTEKERLVLFFEDGKLKSCLNSL
jgi:hypothetical protein